MSKVGKSILGFGVKLKIRPEKINIVDTNVIVDDPPAIGRLQDDQTNAVIVPLMAVKEIDALKHTKPILSSRISVVVKDMNSRQHRGDPYFYISQGNIRNYPDLDPSNPDHHVIATYLSVQEDYPDIPITLISNDGPMHTFALALGINISEYEANRADTSVFEHALPHYPAMDFSIGDQGLLTIDGCYEFSQGEVPENGGVVLHGSSTTQFACIREGNSLRPIPADISVLGIQPHTLLPEATNWEMHLAFEQLLNPSKEFVSLVGRAGTGKTLMAIACGLKQVKQGRYDKVMITRPFVYMGDRKDMLGALPGGLEEKTFPWLQPIYDNLEFLASLSRENDKVIKELQGSTRLEILPFYQARGRTLNRVYLIVDEGQNVTHEDMITIGSRAGNGSKVVVTGDVEQIDIYPRDKRVNALSHAVIDLMGEEICATTYLVHPVRSMLANLVATRLRRS